MLIAVFPWLLVTVLDRRGDLRSGLRRLGAPPVILGAAGAGYVLLRVILWLDGPRSLAAVIFAMIAAYAVLLLVERVRPLAWRTVSSGAAVVLLPALLYFGWGYGAAAAGAVAAVVALAAAVAAECHRGAALAAAGLGAAAGGGVGLWLLNVPL
ncbi:hypothetical protein BN1051_01831 [Arthrobacter saudimassiliensis]|uniref:Uncharacterized protein n=1 Tax=Arthrobacter saudimassiliensis TaxID=1461584 RepID=A0A078MQD1_9MICC|nr:hypothetical protein BN1051_01831 [Arthrobacter saudimassiliensis]